MSFTRRLACDRSGATAVEYALIISIVGLGIALAAFGLGQAISGSITNATANITHCGRAC